MNIKNIHDHFNRKYPNLSTINSLLDMFVFVYFFNQFYDKHGHTLQICSHRRKDVRYPIHGFELTLFNKWQGHVSDARLMSYTDGEESEEPVVINFQLASGQRAAVQMGNYPPDSGNGSQIEADMCAARTYIDRGNNEHVSKETLVVFDTLATLASNALVDAHIASARHPESKHLEGQCYALYVPVRYNAVYQVIKQSIYDDKGNDVVVRNIVTGEVKFAHSSLFGTNEEWEKAAVTHRMPQPETEFTTCEQEIIDTFDTFVAINRANIG